MRASFTPSFFHPIQISDTPEPSRPAAREQTPLTYSRERYDTVDNFIRSADFKAFEQEYKSVLDRITDFVGDHADRLDPPLSDETRKTVPASFDVLKEHLFKGNFFNPPEGQDTRPQMYGNGKDLFHQLDISLKEERFPLQRRMDAVTALAPRLEVCAGGLLSDLEKTIAALKTSALGLKGTAHKLKINMMETLILQHAKARHVYSAGNEIHYVNAYYNRLADEMGVAVRQDPFADNLLNGQAISQSDLDDCKAQVLAKLKPTRLAAEAADQYRGRLEETIRENGIAPGAISWEQVKRLEALQKNELDPEYGEVSSHAFLEPLEEDWSVMAYTGTRRPTNVTRHFLKALRKEDLVEYDKNSKIVLGETGEERILMLEDLFWLKDKDGKVQELTAQHVFGIAPEALLDNLEKAEPTQAQARASLLQFIARRVHDLLEATGEARAPLEKWLYDFAGEMPKRQSWAPGWTDPLILLATALNTSSALDALLTAGGDPNVRGEDGRTALMLATQGGSVEAVNVLTGKGADKEAKDNDGLTALMQAAQAGKVDTLNALLQAKADKDAKNNNGHTALMLAAWAGKVDTLNALIEAGADKEAKMPTGHTALMLAAQAGKVDTLNALLQAKADKEARTTTGHTALMIAAQAGKVDTLNALLQAKADKDARTTTGHTALTLAAQAGKVDTLNALLAAGADKDARTTNGYTALMIAAQAGKVDTLNALLAAGADKDAKSTNGHTALMNAAYDGKVEIAKVLMQHGTGGVDELMTAARDNYYNYASSDNEVMSIRAASTLLQAGADGVTALLTLARQDDTPALKRLIKAGVDKVKDAQGRTVLMRAVELTSASGDNGEMALKALKTLLAAGADITLQDNEGKTAQEHAALLAADSGDGKALRAFIEAATPKRSVIARMFGR